MFSFGEKSLRELDSCHLAWRVIFNVVIGIRNCTIMQGHRGEEEQDDKYDAGLSEVRWPNSKHNKNPSLAVDAGPWPLVYPDRKLRPEKYIKDLVMLYQFAVVVKMVARDFGIGIRGGDDWDGDWDLHDQKFDDVLHFELTGEGLERFEKEINGLDFPIRYSKKIGLPVGEVKRIVSGSVGHKIGFFEGAGLYFYNHKRQIGLPVVAAGIALTKTGNPWAVAAGTLLEYGGGVLTAAGFVHAEVKDVKDQTTVTGWGRVWRALVALVVAVRGLKSK